MKDLLFTFTGCANAAEYYLQNSPASDKKEALTACAQLKSVSEQLLTSIKNPTDDREFQQHFEGHISVVLESIRTIRSCGASKCLDESLIVLLEVYYAAADSLEKGESVTVTWQRLVSIHHGMVLMSSH